MNKKIISKILCCIFLIASINTQAQPNNYELIRMENEIYHEDVVSVKLEKRGVNFSLPVIDLNSREQLTLTICDVGNGTKNLYYTFIHCTYDWLPTPTLNPNEYLGRFTEDYISDYETSVNTIPFYTAYTLDFPNDNMRISKSGNYILYVYEDDTPILTQRFYVVETLASITPLVQQSTNVSTRYTHQEVSFQVGTSKFRVNDPSRNMKVVVMQNGRSDNAYISRNPALVRGESIAYGLPNEITFEAGNEFRIFNLRSLKSPMEGVARHARTDDMIHSVLLIDKAKSYNAYEEVLDINGCYFVANDDRSYSSAIGADFSLVHFSFMGNIPDNMDIYVYGELTNWTLQPDAKLTYNPHKRTWETSLFLRMGYYNYIYIAVPKSGGKGTTFYTEGNFWQTENRYTFFAYYQGDGVYYDRIIGYAQCFSFGKGK